MIAKSRGFKNFIWNAIGLTLYSFTSMVLLITVKLANGVDEAGIFTYSFSICTLFFYISMYYNRTFQIADNFKIKEFNKYFSTRLLTSIVSLILIVVFSIISGFNSYKILIIFLLMIYRTFDAISDALYGYLQQKDKLYLVGISYSLKSMFGVLAFIIMDVLTKNVVYSITILVLINLFFLIVFDYIKYKKNSKEKLKLDFGSTKIILKSSFSVCLFSFISIYLANCQKYIITYSSSNEIQTIFGILIMPATFLTLMGNYLILPFINKLNNYFKNNDFNSLKKLTNRIIMLLFLFGILAIIACSLLGIPVLDFVYQMKLDEYKLELLVIVLASIFNAAAMILSGLLTIINENKVQVYIYAICAIISTLVCYIGIKKSIIIGATISYLVSCVMLFAIYYIVYKYKLAKIEELKITK